MKKSTKIIIAVVAVLAIAALVFAILFFATDIFKKKPKDGFYKALDKVSAIEDKEVGYEEVISKLKSAKNDSSETNAKITMDLKLKGENSQVNQYLDLLKKLEFDIDSKVDASSSLGQMDINIKYDGKDLGTINSLMNSEEVGIKIDGVTDKYYTVDKDDLKGLTNTAISKTTNSASDDYSSSSISNQASKINSITKKVENINVEELVTMLDIKDSDIARIIKRYEDVLKNTISEDKYSSEKSKITVCGKSVDSTAYTVTLTAKDIMNFAKAAVSSMKEDTETLNLFVDKVNKFMELMGQKNSKISKNTLISYLDNLATSFNNSDTESSDFTIKITLYEANKDVVRIKAAMEGYAIMIDSIKDGDTTKGAVILKLAGNEFTLFTTETTVKNDNKFTFKISTDLSQFKALSSSMPSAKFEMTADVDGNNVKLKLYADIENVAEATLNVDAKIEFKSVNIDKLTSSNSKKADTLSDTEKNEILTKFVSSLATKTDAVKAIASDLGVSESQLSTLMSQLSGSSALLQNKTITDTTTSSNATVSTPSLTENLDIDFSGALDFTNATIIPGE